MTTTNRQRWALGVASAASFMVALDALVVATALTRIRLDLDASLGQLEWTVNAYMLSFAGFLMAASAIGDRLGRRLMFTVGLVIFTAASAACAIAPTISWLIAARAAQGLGGALILPLAVALLGEAFPGPQRGRAIGFFYALTGLAVLSGPVIGGAVTQGLAWQWIFLLNVPVGLLVIPAGLLRLAESRGPSVRFDAMGAILVTATGLSVVWGCVQGPSLGWSSAEVTASLGGAVVLAAGFAGWELRSDHPMLPIRLFRSGRFAGGIAAGFFLSAALTGVVFFVAQFLQAGRGYDPLAAGLRLLPWTATLFFVAPLTGAAISRLGEWPLITGGMVLQAGGLVWMAVLVKAGVPYWQLVPAMIIAGAGVSVALPAAQTAVIAAVRPHEIGTAAGAYNMFRYLGSSCGVAILAAAFAAGGGYQSTARVIDGFAAAALGGAGLSVLAAVAGLATRTRRAAATTSAPVTSVAPMAELASHATKKGI